MPRFEPFLGIHYDPAKVDLAAVTAPPYDVLSADDRAHHAAASAYNVVAIDLPVGPNGYADAASDFARWQTEGVLTRDRVPSLYLYRMDHVDEAGRAHHTTGVMGALTLEPPLAGDILPHERTTPKAKSDRLELLRATDANLSAVWGLSMAPGLTALCELDDARLFADFTDDAGVRHRLQILDDPARVAAICAHIAAAPVVIADGHHRFSTCLTYQQECRAALGDRADGYDATLTFVVELTAEELHVQAIHRLVRGLPDGVDLVAALEQRYEDVGPAPATPAVLDAMEAAGAIAVATPAGVRLLRAKDGQFDGVADLDTARLDHALAAVTHELTYQHGVTNVLDALQRGEAQAAVFVRPVKVAQIQAMAEARELMPPKSTFFAPKPKTGLVFRTLREH